MDLKQAKKILLQDPQFRKIREEKELTYKIADMVIDARIARGLTQGQLAHRVDTKQPSIARLENGSASPSITFLKKIADALDTNLKVEFEPISSEQVVVEPIRSSIRFFSGLSVVPPITESPVCAAIEYKGDKSSYFNLSRQLSYI